MTHSKGPRMLTWARPEVLKKGPTTVVYKPLSLAAQVVLKPVYIVLKPVSFFPRISWSNELSAFAKLRQIVYVTLM